MQKQKKSRIGQILVHSTAQSVISVIVTLYIDKTSRSIDTTKLFKLLFSLLKSSLILFTHKCMRAHTHTHT